MTTLEEFSARLVQHNIPLVQSSQYLIVCWCHVKSSRSDFGGKEAARYGKWLDGCQGHAQHEAEDVLHHGSCFKTQQARYNTSWTEEAAAERPVNWLDCTNNDLTLEIISSTILSL